MIQLLVNRDLSIREFTWLKKGIKEGEALNLKHDIPIEVLPNILSDIRDEEISYKIFMTEHVDSDFYIYAKSVSGIVIKIGQFDKKIYFEYISIGDIEPAF